MFKKRPFEHAVFSHDEACTRRFPAILVPEKDSVITRTDKNLCGVEARCKIVNIQNIGGGYEGTIVGACPVEKSSPDLARALDLTSKRVKFYEKDIWIVCAGP